MFDNAVKKYRAREDKETARLISGKTSKSKHSSHPGTPHRLDVSPEGIEEAKQKARQELEQLPAQIIRQTQNFREHMHFYVGHGQMNNVEDQTPAPQEKHGVSHVPKELKALLDQIADLEGIGMKAKREILQDEDARKVSLWIVVGMFSKGI